MSTPYPSGPFTPIFGVGGGGGSPFQACKWVTNSSGLVVQRLDLWYSSSGLTGIQVTYSDTSRSQVFGTPANTAVNITFAPGELITSLTLWGNSVGTRCGRIRLTTSLGQTFDYGKDTSGQTAYDGPVGSGVLVGLFGRSGTEIDLLGLVFLNGSVQAINISNVQYTPTLDGTSSGISSVTLSQTHYSNPPNSKRPQEWDFTNSVARTTSTSFTQTSSTMYGASVSVTVSAELFGIGAKTTAGFEWQKTDTQETTNKTEQEITQSWSLKGTLDPGEGLTAQSTCQQGLGIAKYTSTVTLLLSDGTISQYSENGVFNNVVYTKAEATTTPDKDGKPRKPIEGPHPPK